MTLMILFRAFTFFLKLFILFVFGQFLLYIFKKNNSIWNENNFFYFLILTSNL